MLSSPDFMTTAQDDGKVVSLTYRPPLPQEKEQKLLPGIFDGGRGKGGRWVGLTTLPPSSADFLKSGSLNLMEPSGSVQACNGIAFNILFLFSLF